MASLHISESDHGKHKEHSSHHNYRNHHHKMSSKVRRTSGDEVAGVKLPRILLRKFQEYSKAPENFTVVYHSIPVTGKCSLIN